MKYLRLFETEAEYSAATLDYPNVSYIEATDRVSMLKEPQSKAKLKQNDGTIVYIPIDGSSTITSAETSSYSATTVSIELTNEVVTIGEYCFYDFTNVTSVTIPSSVTTISNSGLKNLRNLSTITSKAFIAPSLHRYSLENVKSNGTLYVPIGSDYSEWMKTNTYYLGYYNWTKVEQ